jgi:hypothetical protein
VEYDYTTRVVGGSQPEGSRLAVGTWHATFAYQGERRYSSKTRTAPPSRVGGEHDTYVFDGKLGFDYHLGDLMICDGKVPNSEQSETYCQEMLGVPVTDESRANYDNSWYYPHFLRPNCPAPNFKNFVVLANQERIDGAWCHVVNCAGLVKLWVDPQIGFALRRKEMNRQVGEFLAEYSYTKFIEPVKGLWLPEQCTRLTSPFDDKHLKLELFLEVKKLSVNDQVTDRDFNIDMPPGTRVTGLGKSFMVRGDKTTLLDLVAGNLSQPERKRSVWLLWLIISLLLIMVLSAAIYWRWRSKGRKSLDVGPA